MISGFIKFLNILSSVLALIFLVMLGAMYKGFDPNILLHSVTATPQTTVGVVASTTLPEPHSTAPSISTVASSTKTITVSPPTPSVAKPVAQVKKPVALAVKQSAKITPVVSTPEPLLVEKNSITATSSLVASSSEPGVPSGSGALNQKDILDIVNIERAKAGLIPLGFNIRLSAIAEGKAVDMINKQYFAHVSPTGVDIAQLSKSYGYEYIYIGENLALGDFTSSEDVMTGWMNSPGHRANILNKNYTEVGISALKGNYQGRVVWYAVQEFGAPLSLCPAPNTALEAVIASEQVEISAIEAKIVAIRTKIEQASGDQSLRNSLVDEHNALVDSYNALVATTKANITSFNTTVSIFNDCIGANTASSTHSSH